MAPFVKLPYGSTATEPEVRRAGKLFMWAPGRPSCTEVEKVTVDPQKAYGEIGWFGEYDLRSFPG